MNGRELAEKLDITQGHVSRLRSGERLPSIQLMFAIAGVIDWPTDKQLEAVRGKTYHIELNKLLEPDTTDERQAA